MATVATVPLTNIAETVSSWTERRVEEVISQCAALNQWHRKNFLQADPTDEQRREFEKYFPVMIRMTKLMHNGVSDPSWPLPHLAKKLEHALWCLEEAWQSEHNPMTESQADKVLSSIFPDAP